MATEGNQLDFGWGVDDSPGAGPPVGVVPLAGRLASLAARGVYLGTSSWKYPGWLGKLYDPGRYQVRGKFAKRKFDRECLEEYAGVFNCVGGDFSFYQFPSEQYWCRLFSQVPRGFRFGLKVPEDVTAWRFPELPRYGQRAGRENADFMNSALLRDRFLSPLEPFSDKIGVIMLEFGTIHKGPARTVDGFVEYLDGFLLDLPTERFNFAVEVRNRSFLEKGSDYLLCLRAHNVAHCLSSWTRMPSVAEQLKMSGILTAGHVAARFLLRPGRAYQRAVDEFSPYEQVKEPYPKGREALGELIERCLAEQRTLFAFVNNRLEGNAVETIESVLEGLD